jgi:hypothetical protein
MKLKTIKNTARDWQHELRDHVRGNEGAGETAILAWQIMGGLVVLFGVALTLNMMPEMMRYLKIKRM